MRLKFRSLLIAVLALALLCLSALPAFAQSEKRIYLDLDQEGELYRVDLVWEGATLSDDIGGLRVTLSYDRDFFGVEKFTIGEALKAFSIHMGPQNNDSYPLIFLGASGTGPVEGEGALASVWLRAKDTASGKTALDLTLNEIVDFTDNRELSGLFSVESLELRMDGGISEINTVAAAPDEAQQGGTDTDVANTPDTPVTNTPDQTPASDAPDAPADAGEASSGAADPTASDPQAELAAVGADDRTDPAGTIALIVAALCAVLALVVTILFFIVRRRRKAEEDPAPGDTPDVPDAPDADPGAAPEKQENRED